MSVNWTTMINKVNAFEQDCFRKRVNNKFSAELTAKTKKQIESISAKLESLKSELNEQSYDEINSLINDCSFQIEKVIFKNQSITFLDREKCVMQRLLIGLDYKTTTGKLVIIKNEYFNKNTLLMLNK